MGRIKVAITLEGDTLAEVDNLVAKHLYPNRSRAIQEAVQEKLVRLNRNRLARECAKLVKHEEQILAEEGFNKDMATWPQY